MKKIVFFHSQSKHISQVTSSVLVTQPKKLAALRPYQLQFQAFFCLAHAVLTFPSV